MKLEGELRATLAEVRKTSAYEKQGMYATHREARKRAEDAGAVLKDTAAQRERLEARLDASAAEAAQLRDVAAQLGAHKAQRKAAEAQRDAAQAQSAALQRRVDELHALYTSEVDASRSHRASLAHGNSATADSVARLVEQMQAGSSDSAGANAALQGTVASLHDRVAAAEGRERDQQYRANVAEQRLLDVQGEVALRDERADQRARALEQRGESLKAQVDALLADAEAKQPAGRAASPRDAAELSRLGAEASHLRDTVGAMRGELEDARRAATVAETRLESASANAAAAAADRERHAAAFGGGDGGRHHRHHPDDGTTEVLESENEHLHEVIDALEAERGDLQATGEQLRQSISLLSRQVAAHKIRGRSNSPNRGGPRRGASPTPGNEFGVTGSSMGTTAEFERMSQSLRAGDLQRTGLEGELVEARGALATAEAALAASQREAALLREQRGDGALAGELATAEQRCATYAAEVAALRDACRLIADHLHVLPSDGRSRLEEALSKCASLQEYFGGSSPGLSLAYSPDTVTGHDATVGFGAAASPPPHMSTLRSEPGDDL